MGEVSQNNILEMEDPTVWQGVPDRILAASHGQSSST